MKWKISTKRGIQKYLKERYVYSETSLKLTEAEFYNVLDEEYDKVKAWRLKQRKAIENGK